MVQLRSALQSSHSHISSLYGVLMMLLTAFPACVTTLAFIPSCLIDDLTLLVKLSLMYGIFRIKSGSGRGFRGVELVSTSSLSRACNMCFVTTSLGYPEFAIR